jgi:hypothetical protein
MKMWRSICKEDKQIIDNKSALVTGDSFLKSFPQQFNF